jgi:YegS/Rv2252/BmrU family lipid kinase
VERSRAIFLNARSGKSLDKGNLVPALRRAGLSADIHCIPADGDVTDWLANVSRDYDVLIAAGGDGTVSAVAAAAVSSGKTLGVIPAGTLNHFARDLGIPLELDKAVAVVAANHVRQLDVAVVNESLFINNASIGAYPAMIWERNRAREKGFPRLVAQGIAVFRAWLDLRSIKVRVGADTAEFVRRSPLVFVGNSKYEVEGLRLGKRLTMTDGSLSVYVLADSGRLDALTLPIRALLGRLEAHEKFEGFQAASVSIEAARHRIGVAIDGEMYVLAPPLRFSIKPRALRAIVPVAQDS